ncbi:MAG: carbohydrate kinase family protein [Gammaproteobacteria bacterium]|jgi:adenosine kinase|nr:carbohydrate kinase family protein [Gammaproteobacteria bacterium]MBT4492917.1 carbohydrate kinase family protein [Gammaproteobacteria bacterium]
MKRTVLISGSTAIDQTGFYAGDFAEYESGYSINALNVSFQLREMQTSFGGCAPNIAWGLTQLGITAIPLSSAGRNFRDRYLDHLVAHGIDTSYIAINDDSDNCASCMMINDEHGNQIIGFYPGPGSPDRKLPSEISEINDVALAILGPEMPNLALAQARDLSAVNVPMIFDPGQVISEYQRAEIVELLSLADILIVNDYEYSVLQKNSGLTPGKIIELVAEVVVTHGANGVEIITQEGIIHVDALPDVRIVDVTGCGDAFRAGYTCGILEDLNPLGRGQFGCIMAMLNLTTPQTQNYKTSLSEIRSLQRKYYG